MTGKVLPSHLQVANTHQSIHVATDRPQALFSLSSVTSNVLLKKEPVIIIHTQAKTKVFLEMSGGGDPERTEVSFLLLSVSSPGWLDSLATQLLPGVKKYPCEKTAPEVV